MTSDGIVAVGVLGVVFAGAIVALRTVAVGRASLRWPTAQGRVVALEVVTVQRGHQGSTTYRPAITYRYSVEGREYERHRIRVANGLTMGVETWTQHEAHAVLDGYFPGSPVAVYYNPRKPGQSVLQPGATRAHHIAAVMLVCGGAIAAGFFCMLFFGQA